MQLRHHLGHPPQHGAVPHLLHAHRASGQVPVARAVVELQVHGSGQPGPVQRLRGDELGVAIDERFRSAPVDAHQHQIVLRAPFVVQSHKLVGEAVHEHFGPGALGAPVRSHVTQEVASKVLEVALRVDLDRDVRPRDAICFAFSHGHSKRAGLSRYVINKPAGRKAPRDLFTRSVLRCRVVLMKFNTYYRKNTLPLEIYLKVCCTE